MTGAAAPGARWDGRGVRFALFSEHAAAVELCLFDDASAETERHSLSRGTDGLWEIHLPGKGPGQLYGYRVHGPFEPTAGHRFNPSKLLVDPYARALSGEVGWHVAILGSEPGAEDAFAQLADSAPWVPRSVVIDPAFDWEEDRPPRTAWEDTVIYECHVRGMTIRHPEVPPELRGTYLGLAEPPVLDHLQSLGVTAVELLPVHHNAPETHLLAGGRPNYFGYSPLAWFAPHAGYAARAGDAAPREFKRMVKALHSRGIEVLVDVVFNHSCEGDQRGPTLCLRGIDNRAYYRLRRDDPRLYEDFTGCGNTLDCGKPATRRLILDCLRYWAEELHVDGFRFDLAPTLGRTAGGFDREAPLFEELAADPVLSAVKLIAEPWDLGPGGYRLGQFPDAWSEWNDRYRDGVRLFWRGEPSSAARFRQALAGNHEIFAPRRGPRAGIAYVTCHDGFTLADLVSYERKHNLDNGEDNRDGSEHNLSRNWGVEGPTDSPRVRQLRLRLQRTFLASLALSAGVPMLSHGDELGRSQRGNNNAYCQDNEITWLDWQPGEDARGLLRFARRALSLRRELLGGDHRLSPASLRWLAADGGPLRPRTRETAFGVLVSAPAGTVLALFNGGERQRLFRLPGPSRAGAWRQALNTAHPNERTVSGGSILVAAHSLVVLRPTCSSSRPTR